MSIVKIDYSDIKTAAKRAKDAAEYYEDYADDLSKKVRDKLDESKLPESDDAGYISSARSSLASRISALRKKKDYYSDLSDSIYKMKDNIEDHEGNVVKEVRKIATNAMGLNKTSKWEAFCQWLYGTFCVDLANLTPITRALGNLIKTGLDWVQEKGTKIVNWFKAGEGRYVLDIVLSVAGVIAAIAGTVAAVVLAVATGGAAIPLVIAAVASVIATTLTVVDTIVSVVNDVKSLKILKDTNDPGQARFYGNIDDVGELTKRRDFGGAKANKNWEIFGVAHDVTREVAGFVATVAGMIGSAGLTGVKVKDPNTGKMVLKTEYDPSKIKPNLIKAAQEKLGLQKVDGKWKFSIKRMITAKENAHGVMDKADILKKNAILDWRVKNKNIKALEKMGPVNLAVLVSEVGVEKYLKHIDDAARRDHKILSNIEKYAKKPKKIKSQIENWGKVLDDSNEGIDRVKSALKIIESTDLYVSDQAGTINDTNESYEKIKDLIEKIKNKDEGAA